MWDDRRTQGARFGFLLWSLTAGILAQDPELDSVLRDLTSETFAVREAATQSLLHRGEGFRARLQVAKEALPLEARLRVEAVLAALGTRVSAERVDLKATLVRLSVQDLPLPTLLDRLGTLGGVVIRLGAGAPAGVGNADPTGRRVTMDFEEMPFFRAVDQVCRELGYTMGRDYQSGDFLLSPGPPPSSFVAYPGPLRVELTGLSHTRHVQFQGPTTSSANLQVRIDVESGTPILGLLQPLEVQATKDDLGGALVFPRPPRQGRHVMNFEQQRQAWLGVAMEVPDGRATKIPLLSLPLSVLVATEMVHAEDSVPPLTPLPSDPGPFSVDHVFEAEEEMQIIISFLADAPLGDGSIRQAPRGEKFVVLDGQGLSIPIAQMRPGASREGREVRTLVVAKGSAPRRVQAKWVRSFEVRDLVAEFRDVPLL